MKQEVFITKLVGLLGECVHELGIGILPEKAWQRRYDLLEALHAVIPYSPAVKQIYISCTENTLGLNVIPYVQFLADNRVDCVLCSALYKLAITQENDAGQSCDMATALERFKDNFQFLLEMNISFNEYPDLYALTISDSWFDQSCRDWLRKTLLRMEVKIKGDLDFICHLWWASKERENRQACDSVLDFLKTRGVVKVSPKDLLVLGKLGGGLRTQWVSQKNLEEIYGFMEEIHKPLAENIALFFLLVSAYLEVFSQAATAFNPTIMSVIVKEVFAPFDKNGFNLIFLFLKRIRLDYMHPFMFKVIIKMSELISISEGDSATIYEKFLLMSDFKQIDCVDECLEFIIRVKTYLDKKDIHFLVAKSVSSTFYLSRKRLVLEHLILRQDNEKAMRVIRELLAAPSPVPDFVWVELEKMIRDPEITAEKAIDWLKSATTDSVVVGPLELSTDGLIDVIRLILSHDPSTVVMEYTEDFGYVLHVGEREVFLNLLLQSTDMSQLILSQDLLNLLQPFIDELTGIDTLNLVDENLFLNHLHVLSQRVLYEMTGLYYEHVNQIMRGEAIEVKGGAKSSGPDMIYRWKHARKTNQGMLLGFLFGVVHAHAVNALYRKLWQRADVTYLFNLLPKKLSIDEMVASLNVRFPSDPEIYDRDTVKSLLQFITPECRTISRFEEKTDNMQLRMRRESAKVSRFSHPVSFSKCVPSGFASGFRTVFETHIPPVILRSFIPEELESIIPALSGSFVYHSDHAVFTERRSPADVRQLGMNYLPLLAIAHAHRDILSKPYSDGSSRANHATAHSYRCMLYIDLIIHYLASHASDPELRTYCRIIAGTDQADYLQVVAAFHSSGRDSEIPFSVNAGLNEGYRDRTRDNIEKFLRLQGFSDEMVDRLATVGRYTGNPKFSSDHNVVEDSAERKIREFMHIVLSISHSIDLLRCYNSREYKPCVDKWIVKYSDTSAEQIEAAVALLRYAEGLMRAHQDTLFSRIGEGGGITIEDCYVRYGSSFDRINDSVYQLILVSQTVPIPVLSHPLGSVPESVELFEKALALDPARNVSPLVGIYDRLRSLMDEYGDTKDVVRVHKKRACQAVVMGIDILMYELESGGDGAVIFNDLKVMINSFRSNPVVCQARVGEVLNDLLQIIDGARPLSLVSVSVFRKEKWADRRNAVKSAKHRRSSEADSGGGAKPNQ